MDDDKRFRDRTQTIRFQASDVHKALAEARKAFLTVIRGGGRDLGLHVVVHDAVVLGRAPDCDLSLLDLGISWHHARVHPGEDHAYLLEDLASTNGTRVNGMPVAQPWTLADGDKIFLGETVVRFSLADEMDVGFQSQVAHLVGTDPLTGLESKRRFDDALDYGLEQARRLDRPLSVLMMDMDGVKRINDSHGHLFGAHAIGETGRIIARTLEGAGHACRFGGDEFTAFLPDRDRQAAVAMAESIRRAVEEAGMVKDGIALAPTISIGVATYPHDGQRLLDLVAAADRALYQAKAAGRNQVR